jgi:monoamine oxidase
MKKITIIGAGISGLYLASLLENDYEVTILEARDRIGGRVFSIDNHDMGPSWVWSHHKSMLELIDKFSLKLISQYTKGYALYDTKDKVEPFIYPSSMPSFRVDGSMFTLVEAIHKSLKNTKVFLSQEVKNVICSNKQVNIETLKDTFISDFVVVAIPPRLALKINFSPKMPELLYKKMKNTPTWMAHTAKCVIEFKNSFWRKKSLSGFVFSHIGPLGEIHDLSSSKKHALFGFVSTNAKMKNFEEDLKNQLKRLFHIDLSQIISINLVNWRDEKYTATKDDINHTGMHPDYGIDTDDFNNKIFFSSTEFSFLEGGYLEGALIRAKHIASKIHSQI